VVAFPDHREDWAIDVERPRKPGVKDRAEGIRREGTVPEQSPQGVHSLTDVPVFAMGPCQELFGGVYNNIDVFFKMAECLGLSEK
jgi:alkaline phosphatase